MSFKTQNSSFIVKSKSIFNHVIVKTSWSRAKAKVKLKVIRRNKLWWSAGLFKIGLKLFQGKGWCLCDAECWEVLTKAEAVEVGLAIWPRLPLKSLVGGWIGFWFITICWGVVTATAATGVPPEAATDPMGATFTGTMPYWVIMSFSETCRSSSCCSTILLNNSACLAFNCWCICIWSGVMNTWVLRAWPVTSTAGAACIKIWPERGPPPLFSLENCAGFKLKPKLLCVTTGSTMTLGGLVGIALNLKKKLCNQTHNLFSLEWFWKDFQFLRSGKGKLVWRICSFVGSGNRSHGNGASSRIDIRVRRKPARRVRMPRGNPGPRRSAIWWLWRPCRRGRIVVRYLVIWDRGSVVNITSAMPSTTCSTSAAFGGLPDDVLLLFKLAHDVLVGNHVMGGKHEFGLGMPLVIRDEVPRL